MDFAKAILQLAVDVYKRDANIRIVPLKPFQYDSGFAGAEVVDDSWVVVDEGTADELLDIPNDERGWMSDWGHAGSQFQLKASTCCFYGAWRRVVGYGAPVTCFVVRSIPGAAGHALWVTDYVRVESQSKDFSGKYSSPRTLGHELGHACNLFGHTCPDDDIQNIMAARDGCDGPPKRDADRVNPRLSDWQALVVRASKHVTYF
jgi:hypothetical protein